MKKSIIFLSFICFLLFNAHLAFSQFGAGTNSPLPITVHGTSTTGVYVGKGLYADPTSTAVGLNALSSTNAGQTNDNTAVGANSQKVTSTGDRNSSFGSGSLALNTTGLYNCVFGFNALKSSSIISGNNAFGDNCLANLTSAAGFAGDFSHNNGFGYMTMNALTTGFGNSAFGHGCILNLIVGDSNTAIGAGALLGLNYGNNNVGIGHSAVVPGGAGTAGAGNSNDNNLSIQNVIYGVNMKGAGVGNVGIAVLPANVAAVATGEFSKLHLGGSSGTSMPSLQLDYVPNGTNSTNKFLYVDPVNGIVRQDIPKGVNSCAVVNYLPKTNNANGNMDCSVINQVNSNIGIAVASPISKVDIDCIANSGNGHIRLRNLTQWPTTNPNTNFLLIDSNGDLWKSNGLLSKGQVGSPTIDIDQNETIQQQQTEIEKQQIKIASLEIEIDDLKNKVNQLVPGCITVKDDNFQITPNPVTGTSTVSYKIDATISNATFIVYDLQGKMLRKYTVNSNAKEGQVQINKNDFGNGMYILSLVSNGNEIQSKHFIIAE